MVDNSNKPKPVTVKILDKDYMVACPANEQEALIASSKRVDREMRRVREAGKVLGTDRIAVMVALNLAHELIQVTRNIKLPDPEILSRLQHIQQRIDETLQKHKA